MKRIRTISVLAAMVGLLAVLGATLTSPDDPVSMIVVTAEKGAPIWIRAEMISVDGKELPDRVRQTPFAIQFPSRNVKVAFERTEDVPTGYPTGHEGEATFTATYMQKVGRGRFAGEWAGGGLTGVGGGQSGVRFVVTDSSGQVSGY